MKIITTSMPYDSTPLTLSDAFADVAEVLAPVFDNDERFLDEPIGELIWLPRRLALVPNKPGAA